MGHLTNVQRLELLPYFPLSRREAVLWPKGQGSRLAHDAQGGAVVLWPTGQSPRPTALRGGRARRVVLKLFGFQGFVTLFVTVRRRSPRRVGSNCKAHDAEKGALNCPELCSPK